MTSQSLCGTVTYLCQKCKKSKKKFGRLKALSPTEQPFDLVAIDTIEGLGEYG